ncbi:hypothetical protein ZWY2020_060108 [Hordeum vulgare]|nr:hypothetical protein ZWY2020_060108 [Hordeum vulgare]
MFCSKLTMHEQDSSVLATKVFTISGDQLYALKRHCGGASTFCAVSALVWQCLCIARQLDPDATTRMNFPVDIRRRLEPRLPGRYFGNGVVNVFASAAVKDVVSGTLASVASRVKATTEQLDDELLRSAIDYFEMEAAKGGRPENRGNLPETELRMNSWFHLPIYDANFGWGKPRVMTRAETVRGGWVYVMAGCGDGSARVLISLEAATLKKFERALAEDEAAGMKRKLAKTGFKSPYDYDYDDDDVYEIEDNITQEYRAQEPKVLDHGTIQKPKPKPTSATARKSKPAFNPDEMMDVFMNGCINYMNRHRRKIPDQVAELKKHVVTIDGYSSDVPTVYIRDACTNYNAFNVPWKLGQGVGILVAKWNDTSVSYSLQTQAVIFH